MTSRTVRILILVIIVSLVCALFLLNPHVVTVNFGQGRRWDAPLALILIVVFVLGALLSGFLAAVTSTQASFKWWRERRGFQLERSHYSQIRAVRELIANGELDEARKTLERMVAQDDGNVVARVHLASVLRDLGEINAALRVLDETRAAEKSNFEVLFLAADLNAEIGNMTAAYDNLSLVLQSDPHSRKALEQLIPYAVALGKFSIAKELKERLIRLSSGTKYQEHQLDLAALELHRAAGLEGAAKRSAVEEVLKRHRDYAPAIEALAKIEAEAGRAEEASKLLIRAYKIDPAVSCLSTLAQLWLDQDAPARAVSSVRSLLPGTPREDSLSGTLFLITLLTHLEMSDEAAAELRKLEERLPELTLQSDVRESALASIAVLKAHVLSRQDKSLEAYRILDELRRKVSPLEGEAGLLRVTVSDTTSTTMRGSRREQPAPQLSTP